MIGKNLHQARPFGLVENLAGDLCQNGTDQIVAHF